jgi:hypothetical protein
VLPRVSPPGNVARALGAAKETTAHILRLKFKSNLYCIDMQTRILCFRRLNRDIVRAEGSAVFKTNPHLPTHPCLHLLLMQYIHVCLQTTVCYNHLNNYMYSLYKALITCCLASKIQQNQTNVYHTCPNTYPTVSYVIICHMHISIEFRIPTC